jgi:hypothetical protein
MAKIIIFGLKIAKKEVTHTLSKETCIMLLCLSKHPPPPVLASSLILATTADCSDGRLSSFKI